MVDYQTIRVRKLGATTVGIRLPMDWCAHHKLSTGDPLYITGMLDGSIRIDYRPSEWASEARLLIVDSVYPAVSIPQGIAKPRGIASGTLMDMDVDSDKAIVLMAIEGDHNDLVESR